MVDDAFVPFVPRRLAERAPETASSEPSEPPAESRDLLTEPTGHAGHAFEASADASAGGQFAVAPAITSIAEAQVSAAQAESNAASSTTCDAAPQYSECAETRSCSHFLGVRNEAIRLAAIACGRALRRAVVLHPQTIAGFVDDAIAAAGYPHYPRIYLHASSIATAADVRHECISDASLRLGDVTVECDGSRLSATVEERAGLLVLAAAEL